MEYPDSGKVEVMAMISTETVTAVNDWLNCGMGGVSADAMLAALTVTVPGVCTELFDALNSESHPHDADDLGRCIRLLEIAPRIKNELRSIVSSFGTLGCNCGALGRSRPLTLSWRPRSNDVLASMRNERCN